MPQVENLRFLRRSTVKISMRRGEIWLVNLDPTLGVEIEKTRPAVIVNDDAIGILPLKVIVPITAWNDCYAIAPWMVRVDPTSENGLDKPSAADAFQVRSMAQQRLVRRLGQLPETTMQAIT
jgi:mRNA interferase MazF